METDKSVKKLYSPGQVSAASFFGGPLAAIFTLYKNFVTLGNINKAKNTLVVGSLLTFLSLFIIPFLPEDFPNIAISVEYTASAASVATQYQMKKIDIAESDIYSFQSNWKVLGLSLVSIILFLCLVIAIGLSLDSAGYIDLNE